MDEYFQNYLRNLLKECPKTIVPENKITFGIIFYDKEGNYIDNFFKPVSLPEEEYIKILEHRL